MPLREPLSLRSCDLLRGSRRFVPYDGCTYLMRLCMATDHGVIAQEYTNKGRALLKKHSKTLIQQHYEDS